MDCRLRSRVNSVYRKKFATVEDAEIHYGLTLGDSLAELVIDKRPSKPKPVVESENEKQQQPVATPQTSQPSNGQQSSLFKLASVLEKADLKQLLNKLFVHLALAHDITSNLGNFCSFSLQAMELLKKNHKSNLLYKFAFAMCQTNPVTGEPVFPMDRMPFGLVEYQIEFFSCTNVNQVRMSTKITLKCLEL